MFSGLQFPWRHLCQWSATFRGVAVKLLPGDLLRFGTGGLSLRTLRIKEIREPSLGESRPLRGGLWGRGAVCAARGSDVAKVEVVQSASVLPSATHTLAATGPIIMKVRPIRWAPGRNESQRPPAGNFLGVQARVA